MYTVEYSPSQKCIHLDELNKVVEINFRKFITRQESDWILIGVFETEGEANKFCEKAIQFLQSKGE